MHPRLRHLSHKHRLLHMPGHYRAIDYGHEQPRVDEAPQRDRDPATELTTAQLNDRQWQSIEPHPVEPPIEVDAARASRTRTTLPPPPMAQADRAAATELTTAQLNDRQWQALQPQAPLAQMKVEAAQASTPSMPAAIPGPASITYHFTVGDDKTPHVYEAVRNNDGQVTGQAYVVDKAGHKTAATMEEFQTDMLRRFATEDMAAGRVGHDVSLTAGQQNRMADRHASELLALLKATEGAAKQKEVENMLVRHPNMVADWIHSHIREARDLLQKPNYMAIAEKYRLEHPDNLLSEALGAVGVKMGTPVTVATGSKPGTQPTF